MKQIQDALEPNICFPVFEEGDIVYLEYDGQVPVEAKILSCSYFDYFHNGKGHGVTYRVADKNETIHNVWGFCIKELR